MLHMLFLKRILQKRKEIFYAGRDALIIIVYHSSLAYHLFAYFSLARVSSIALCVAMDPGGKRGNFLVQFLIRTPCRCTYYHLQLG